MRDLKVWIEIKLAENPDLDDRKLIETFTDLYYGPEAGAAIRRYRDLLGAAADKAGASVRWFPNLSDYAFLDAKAIGAFYALRKEAIRAVRADPERTMRVANAFSSLDRYYLLRAAPLRGNPLLYYNRFQGVLQSFSQNPGNCSAFSCAKRRRTGKV